MTANFEIRRGLPEERDALLSFLNEAFGYPDVNGVEFSTFLPKLYDPEHDPCGHNLLAVRDGEIIGAVGIYERDFKVGDMTLHSYGIGNVACRADARGGGVMTTLMRRVIADMTSSGADFSDLGGRRHRYGHFGYESAGLNYTFTIRRDAMRHIGADVKTDVTAVYVTPSDTSTIDSMYEFFASQPFHAVRPRDVFYKIITTWYGKPIAFARGGDFLGYVILRGDSYTELILRDAADFASIIKAIFDLNKQAEKIELSIPPYDAAILNEAYRFMDYMSTRHCEQINIFNFSRFVDAFLRLKASIEPLPDGESSFIINGEHRTEAFHISVKEGVPFVEPLSTSTDTLKAIHLSHNEAISFFTGILSPARSQAPLHVKAWFPLPVYIPYADHV